MSFYHNRWRNIMASETDIVSAINNTVRVEFVYNGEQRVVEPHIIGRTKNNRTMVRGYQVGGKSSSGRPLPAWALFDVENIQNFTFTDRKFSSRLFEGYTSKDPVITQAVAAL